MSAQECTPEEWYAIQSRACHYHLGVGRERFLLRWRQGIYDWDQPLEATSVAMLFSDEELAR